jgi:DNA processing protein
MHLSTMRSTAPDRSKKSRGAKYAPPRKISKVYLSELLTRGDRSKLEPKQLDFLRREDNAKSSDISIYCAGNLSLLDKRAVSIVGTREVSDEGRRRAEKLACGFAEADILVVSGLARGVDSAAHIAAIECKGSTAAVIGTPLTQAYPAENARLQELIYSQYLLLSPFAENTRVYRGNFPARNRVMAAITDATIIIEASDTSGTLHQAAECVRLGRLLFILKSVVDNDKLTWPKRFLDQSNVFILTKIEDVLNKLR